MKKEASLKQKMKAQDKGERDTSNLELPEVRSSAELLRRFKIKREKIISNLRESNVLMAEVEGANNKQNKRPTTTLVSSKAKGLDKQNKGSNQSLFVASDAQFKLSNFAASGQTNLNSNRELDTTKKNANIASMTQSKLPSQKKSTMEFMQGKGPTEIQNSKRQPMKKAVAENDEPRAKQQPLKGATAEDGSSRPKQQLAKRAMAEDGSSRPKQQPAKRAMAGDGSSRPKQQPTKRAMADDGSSRPKQQPTKRAIPEDVNSREKEQSMERVVVEDDESRTGQQNACKKAKRIALCRSMLIDEFLKENGEVSEEEELESESEDEGQNVMEEENEHEEGAEINGDVIEGTSKKRTRGPTQCLQIHARSTEDRQEVTLDDDGEPIGPNDKIVSDLSYFLGTIARNGNFCPLIYTNFKALLVVHKERIWKYVTDKYIISKKGEKAVFSRINDAWRRYKCYIKRRHFLKYSNLRERLKHRPETISETHFRKLMTFWKNNTIQNISKKNVVNRAKQKYMHRMGPINFARIRAQLRAKKEDGQEVTQAEMFIETRQSRRGKAVDGETQTAIAKLQDSIENSSESVEQTFQSLFGKEKPGRVRCYGRTITPTIFKKNEEIATIKKQHSTEMTGMARKIEGLETLIKFMLKQQNPDLDEEAVNDMMSRALGNENSAAATAARSSASTHVPVYEKDGDEEDHIRDIEEGHP